MSTNVPLAYLVDEACEAARASRSSIYRAIRDGELVARKRGRRTVILANDLQDWLERLPPVPMKGVEK